MRKSTVRRLALAASALSSLWAMPALAQGADHEEGSGNDIVVTARRTEEKLQDVPISISVFTPEQLASRNIVNSTDLGTYTPSLTINARYGPDKSSFAIRGFSQDLNTLPSVGVYLADVVAPRLNSNITSGNGAGVGSMFDLQNVQVLKGPQGTLFGRNTTGGAILLVPKRPTDKLEGYIEGTAGAFDLWRVQGVINVPISDTIRVRVGVDRYKRDGYIHNRSGIGPDDFNNVNYTAVRASLLAELTPDLETYFVGTYSWSNTHGMVGKPVVCANGLGTSLDGNLSAATTPIRLANCGKLQDRATNNYGYYDVENTNPNPYVRQRTWQVINTTTWKATENLTVKNIVSYGEAVERYSFSLIGDNIATPFVTTYPGANGIPQGQMKSWTEEFQLQGHSSDNRLNWQAGFYYENSSPLGPQEQYTSIFASCTDVYAFRCTPYAIFGGAFAIGNVSVARNNYWYRDTAVYAQATYKLTDRLSLTGGIRYTWDKVRTTGDGFTTGNGLTNGTAVSPTGLTLFGGQANQFRCSQANTPASTTERANLPTNQLCFLNPYSTSANSAVAAVPAGARDFTQASSKPTWTIDLEYKPTPDILTYAKYSRGYRGGGVNQSNVGNEQWNPEKVDTYELGVKTSFNGALRGTFNITGFYNNFTNQQVSVFIGACTAGSSQVINGVSVACSDPAPVGINGIQNVGKSKIKGIEADLTLNLFEGFRLDAGYAYLSTKVTESNVPACSPTRYACIDAVYLKTGDELFFSPKNRLTITGTYTLPLKPSLGKLSVGITYTHTDQQVFSHNDDHAYSIRAIPFNPSRLPATDLVNLNVNWANVAGAPVDAAFFVTNLTNQEYPVAATNSLSSTGADFAVVGEPRMWGFRLKYHFGD